MQQRFFAGVLCSQFGQGFVEQRLGLGVADVHAGAVVVARETAGVDGAGHAGADLGAPFVTTALLAAAVQLPQGVVHMLGGHGLHALALQVVPGLACGHGLQVAGGAGVHAQRELEGFALELFGVGGHQVVEDAALERQRRLAKQARVQRRQLQQRRRLGAAGPGRGGSGGGIAPRRTAARAATALAARAIRALRGLRRGRRRIAGGGGGRRGGVGGRHGIGHGRQGLQENKPAIISEIGCAAHASASSST